MDEPRGRYVKTSKPQTQCSVIIDLYIIDKTANHYTRSRLKLLQINMKNDEIYMTYYRI